MVNWLGSQPLFIQVAAGMSICLVGFLLATTALCTLLALALGLGRAIDPQDRAARGMDAADPSAASGVATEDLIRALMQDSGKPRDQVETAVYCWSDDERRMTASLPPIRALIESFRSRSPDAEFGHHLLH